ncbi:acyltransferase [Flavobacterium sufflavum]|uniref:Acyltransferase n=1 Tax=Flavobacterium sufflavum TaxID=1921138 RepID=A0A3S2UJ54_9FLAO|nr:acyltransferase [Flavobacterium sufflavum]RVT75890.1 acyltransferase [Flavobacterium sufflavum]
MKIDQLTFTRFLAAISIVIFHYGGKSFPFNNDRIAYIFKGADVGVSYFFILSGFVMIIAYGNKSIVVAKDYFRNRFVRIYPVYFLALFVMFVLQIRTKNLDLSGLFLNVLMIQSWIPGKELSVNSPGWSLSVEFLFYAIFPLMFNKFFKTESLKKNSFLIVLFWIISQVFFQLLFVFYGGSELDITKDVLKYNPLMHLNEFLIGNLAGLFFIQHLQEKKGNYDLVILILAGLVILALKFSLGLNFHNGLLAVLFVPLIICLSLNNGYITKLFQKKSLVFLGEISFGIYILQHPVYSLISSYTVNKYFQINDTAIVFFSRLVVLLVVSSVVYIYIEKPMQNKIKVKRKIVVLS